MQQEIGAGKNTDLGYFRIFGCRAYMHIPKLFRGKFESKMKSMIMDGYSDHTKGYRLADPANSGKLDIDRDVIFLKDIKHAKNVELCLNNQSFA